MLLIIPYLITLLSFGSMGYLLGTYFFIQNNLIQLFQIPKSQLGFIDGVLGFATACGVIPFLMYTTQLKPKIVTSYALFCLGFMIPYILIFMTVTLSVHPSKIILYIAVFMIGLFRGVLFPSILIIVKIHKEIYDRKNSINEQNYKLLTKIWSVSYDAGMVMGFFGCNWLQYTIKLRWEYLIVVGFIFFSSMTALLFFGLRSYIENNQEDTSLVEIGTQKNQSLQSKLYETSFSRFFSLIGNNLQITLFLVNSVIVGILHAGLYFILPIFFYSSGYKGNQGYLVAIYSIFIIVGAWLLAIWDFVIYKISNNFQNKNEDQSTTQRTQQNDKEKISSLVMFSVSLFFFALTLIIMTVLSFKSSALKQSGSEESYLGIQMILMAPLGFFFGPPLKSYFSYQMIKTMGDLEKAYQQQMQTNLQFKLKQTQQQNQPRELERGCIQKITSHKLQIGSSLVTLNRILTHISTIIMFIVAFWLIDHYLSYAMGFLAFLGILAFILDVLHNIVAMKNQEQQEKEKYGSIN